MPPAPPFHHAGMGDAMTERPGAQGKRFRLEEATIDDLHRAIMSGGATCVSVVRHYIDRVRAYNGVASVVVTRDGAAIAAATGAVRAGTRLRFPTQTVKAAGYFCRLISTATKGRRWNTAAWSRPPPTPA